MGSLPRSGTESTRGVTTALIYTRVSSDEQAREGVSLDAQLTACRRYAAEKGWVLGKEYQDVLSGKRDDRREYQQMLTDIRRLRAEGRAVAVIVMRLDRLGRRVLERVRSREELKGLGVPTHSVREGGEVSDLIANILASVAQEEVERLGQRVSDARQYIRANGWKQPGAPAFGYRLRPATDEERKRGAPSSVLEIDPVTAPVVTEMFTRVDGGASARSVSRWLSSLPADVRGDRSFGSAAVRQALSARVYVGRQESGERGNWPALVDDEAFERVQARLADHRRTPRQASGRYLLTGLIWCTCSTRMQGGTGGATIPAQHRYRCNGSALGAGFPNCNRVVPCGSVEAAVTSAVTEILDAVSEADPGLRVAIRRALRTLGRPGENAEPLVRTHEQVAARARERIKRLALLFADGDIDRQGYELGRAQAQADLEAADAELARLRTPTPTAVLPPLEELLRLVGGWRGALGDGDVSARRDVLAALIERVIPERVGYGKYSVGITWTAMGDELRRLAQVAASSRVA